MKTYPKFKPGDLVRSTGLAGNLVIVLKRRWIEDYALWHYFVVFQHNGHKAWFSENWFRRT